MTEFSAILAVCFCAALAIFRSARVTTSLAWLSRRVSNKSKQHPQKKGDYPAFTILLPALREQTTVRETLEHFRSLNYPKDRFCIVVVTTEREKIDREQFRSSLASYSSTLWNCNAARPPLTGHLPGATVRSLLEQKAGKSYYEFQAAVYSAFEKELTTGELVEREAAQDGAPVFHIEAPANWLRKSGQLRYVINNLDEHLAGWPALPDCRYVAVYDFDARSDKDALLSASQISGFPALQQQPGLTVPRAKDGYGTAPSLFSILDGQLHARYCLTHELGSLLWDRRLHKLPGRWRLLARSSRHAVGIGLFIDRIQLPSLGGIPKEVDDLALGWQAAIKNLDFVPLNSPVWYDSYRTLKESKVSRRFIFSGYLTAVKEFQGESSTKKSWSLISRIWLSAGQFAFGALLYAALIVGAFVVQPQLTAAVVAFAYALLVADIARVHRLWAVYGVAPRMPFWLRLTALLLSPAALLWKGKGPRALLAERVRKSGVNPSVITKTER